MEFLYHFFNFQNIIVGMLDPGGSRVDGFRRTGRSRSGVAIMQIIVAGKIHASGIALLQASGVSFQHVEALTEAAYVPLIDQADALVIRTQPLTATTIAKAERLQIVSRHGVGYDAVDVAALTARRIPLCIVGSVNAVSVAEHAMMLILAATKRLIRADHAVRCPTQWSWRNRMEAAELAGKTLLILGYGRSGQLLARMAAGFGMTIIAHDPHLAPETWPKGATRALDLHAGLAQADVVSLHAPLTTPPLIGAAELAAMKAGAILINTARGGLVDEPALLAALRSGHVAAAGLDVLTTEPPAPDHPLLALDQVIFTPHIAGITAESAERMAVASVRNVLDFFAGRLDTALIVNQDQIVNQRT